MAVPIEELKLIDYKILKFIGKYDSALKEDINKKFKNIKAIKYRLSRLSQFELNQKGMPVDNTSYIKCNNNGGFYITELGKKALQDYKNDIKIRLWDLTLKLWLPLVISLAALAISIYGLFQPIDVRLV